MTNRLNFPSSNQLKYTQNVFPTGRSGPLPPDVILNILVETDDQTFDKLCSSPEFASFCSSNSAYSERIYEERAKRRVEKKYSSDIIQFKPAAMTWREFDNRISKFIKYTPDTINLVMNNQLMELKILYATTGELLNIRDANRAAEYGHLDILKWIYEQFLILPNIDGANGAAWKGHLDVLKWIYEQDHNIIPDITGANFAAEGDHLDVLKWIYEQTGALPTTEAANEVAYDGLIGVVDWLASKGVFPYTYTTVSN